MYRPLVAQEMTRWPSWLLLLLPAIVFSLASPWDSRAVVLESQYPGLALGLLRSAELQSLDDETLLMAEGFTITRSQLLGSIKDQDPKLRPQLEKNLIFLLEQEAIQQMLRSEAHHLGITVNQEDDTQVIQTLFERWTEKITVSENEVRSFYEANKEMMTGAPFEQVAESIRQYLLQEEKQQAISAQLGSLETKGNLRINKSWVEDQGRLALDNPVDQARLSGRPTLVEFGATGCVPCDMMQPILDQLRVDYPDRLNVVFVHVGEEQILAARYGIRSIPVQAFFDAEGREVFRHTGFFAQKEVEKQLSAMGLDK